MADLSISILIDKAHLHATESIARTIGERGFTVERVVRSAGVIRAYGEESNLEVLRQIEGVMEAKPEEGVRLPKMDSRIPQ